MELNEKQKRFCQEYVIDLNGTQAAIRAGYGEKSAYSTANEILKYPEVQQYISKLNEKRSAKLEITAERVLAELAKIAFADTRNVAEWNGYDVKAKDSSTLSDDAAATISEVSAGKHGVKVKLHDKVAALDKLGKHLKLFNDHKVEVEIGKNLAELIDDARKIK